MPSLLTREPAVSGSFYPSNADALLNKLHSYTKAANRRFTNVRALIVPHAGYKYSGQVAAHAYSSINSSIKYDNVFILAPAHRFYIKGASIGNYNYYETPLGKVEVNTTITSELIKKSDLLSFKHEAHIDEHAIEVQLPFIQNHFLHKPCIVPILIGENNKNGLKEISKLLRPYFTPKNLFIISTDFSHYTNYTLANTIDKKTGDALTSLNWDIVENVIKENHNLKANNLKTCACGSNGLQILFGILNNSKAFELNQLDYKNSGDRDIARDDGVVGYWAMCLTENKDLLSQTDKTWLLNHVSNALRNLLLKESRSIEQPIPSIYEEKMGVFVTLRVKGELRGCIGRFTSGKPLYRLIEEVAISSALSDSRFDSIEATELDHLQIEISLLSPLKRIYSVDDIEIGKHGIYLISGPNRGTLLPEVASNNNWNVKEFLAFCAKHKMGLSASSWKSSEIYTYTTTKFKGPFKT